MTDYTIADTKKFPTETGIYCIFFRNARKRKYYVGSADRLSRMGILTLMTDMKAAVDREFARDFDITRLYCPDSNRALEVLAERRHAYTKNYDRLFKEVYALMETGNYEQLGTTKENK